MKKILTTLACGAILAVTASADFGRVEMGVGALKQTPSGAITYVDGATASDTSNEKDSTSAYAWMLVKHPIPILPNIRLEYTNLENDGEAIGTFEDFTVSGGSTLLEMTQYDVIPYYNILDNTGWVTLDLGLDLKVIDTEWTVNNATVNLIPNSVYTDSETLVIPLVYVRARVEIPTTDIGIESDVKYITYDDDTIYDVRVKVDYTFDITPVIQSGIEVGYRIQKFDISEDGDTAGSIAKMDLEFSGVYAGVMLRF